MNENMKETKSDADSQVYSGKEKAEYLKPTLEWLGRVVDNTAGLSLPALESGDPQNRHD
jgi:hypothetical protein